MRKIKAGHLCAVIKGILFIGFSIQIVLGVIWMCFNFTAFQEFGLPESALYSAVFALTGRHPWVMYLGQLILAYFSCDFILRILRPAGKAMRVWSTLALLTFPMAMQCHLAVLPWSFAGSLFLLEWSFAVKILKKEGEHRERAFGGMAVCWILLAFLLPEYRLLGGLPVLFTLLFCLKKLRQEPKKVCLLLLAAVLAGGLAAGGGTVLKKVSGIEDRSISFALASRMAWPSLWADHYGWPEEMQEALGEKIWETSFCPDNMDRILKPMMEEAFGTEQADVYYRIIAENAWVHRTSVILTQMRWDVLGYGATPIVLRTQLEGGNYDSYSGRNYEIMRNHTPVLTKYYVAYSCWWFSVCIVLAFLLTVLYCMRKKCFIWKDIFGGLLVCALSAGILVILYTMRGAGMMDYKMSFAVSSIWPVWALTVMREEETSEEKQSF